MSVPHIMHILFSSSQPVELLHKPLIDFQEDMVPQGQSMHAIYDVYEAQEKERLSMTNILIF